MYNFLVHLINQTYSTVIFHIFENEINTKTFKEDIASSIQSIFEDLLEIILKKCNKKHITKFSLC